MHNLKFLLVLVFPAVVFGQVFSISGTVKDVENNPISFVTIYLTQNVTEDIGNPGFKFIKGTTTDDLGNFTIEGLLKKKYNVYFNYLGYESISQTVALTSEIALGTIVLKKKTETLDEAVIVTKKPIIIKEPGKLTFNIENTSIAVGSTLDVLKKTPGLLVTPEGITLKNTNPTIYINNKRVYLSNSEVQSLLQNTDATAIKSVEVITNPSAKFDAESGTVVNIITSRAISIGYKGSVNGAYEQGVYAKYRLGTSHFYKNERLNFYGGYSFSPRKEFKQDENHINFFNSNQINSIGSRTSDFERTTRSYAHQGNVVADFKVNDKHEIGISANILVSPNKRFDNNARSENFDTNRVLDSVYTTNSNSNIDTSNLAFNLNHTWQLGEAGANVVMNANYILYDNERLQDVETDFFSNNGVLFRENRFFTKANQSSDIATFQLDFSIPALSGMIETGAKFSTIDTQSGLHFFDTNTGNTEFNSALSDSFLYEESIYAAYFSYSADWDSWSLNAGLRGEQTDVQGDSRSLGVVNNQNYFELFPALSLEHNANDNNSYGFSYSRSISRPRYEALNPFRYFVNEFNFSDGNPNLIPAIDTKYTLSYTYKNHLFFELYYWNTDNPLSLIAFQNNQARTLQSLDVNLIREYQYSFDVVYARPVFSWLYLQLVTSSFYIENEFFALESPQEKATIDTYGFYGQVYGGLTISESLGLTSDVTAVYISNLLYGASSYKNQFNLSISFRKDLWNKRASINAGVDDIFNTNNIPVTTRYYNQDNAYFARVESRLFRIGFKYNFGNARLRDNNRKPTTDEGERLN
jgi:hypothetical protein